MLHRWMTPTEPYKALGPTDRYSQLGLGYCLGERRPPVVPEIILKMPYNTALDIQALVAERLPNPPHVNEVAKALIGG